MNLEKRVEKLEAEIGHQSDDILYTAERKAVEANILRMPTDDAPGEAELPTGERREIAVLTLKNLLKRDNKQGIQRLFLTRPPLLEELIKHARAMNTTETEGDEGGMQ